MIVGRFLEEPTWYDGPRALRTTHRQRFGANADAAAANCVRVNTFRTLPDLTKRKAFLKRIPGRARSTVRAFRVPPDQKWKVAFAAVRFAREWAGEIPLSAGEFSSAAIFCAVPTRLRALLR